MMEGVGDEKAGQKQKLSPMQARIQEWIDKHDPKWSRNELARQMHLNESTVGSWFSRGKTGISAEDALKVAQLMGVSVEFLVTGKEPAPPEPAYHSAEQKQLVEWVRILSRPQVYKLWTLAVDRSPLFGLPPMPEVEWKEPPNAWLSTGGEERRRTGPESGQRGA